jgi:hypothetical protein
LGDGELRRIELSERRRALDQGKLGPPHARELKLGLRDLASALAPHADDLVVEARVAPNDIDQLALGLK